MFKKLSQATGEVDQSNVNQESNNKLVRPAILVHAGPNGELIEFACSDGSVKFDEKRIKDIVAAQNSYITDLADQYGGLEKMIKDHVGAFPPILDQHADDSNDRIIGRLASLLRYEVRDVPKIGKNVPCAVADITFLGEETVEKVKDGRIYHLSIGIDENTNVLGETSVVIDPAAPGAMLLNKGKKNIPTNGNGGFTMSKKKLAQAKADRLTKLNAMAKDLTSLESRMGSAQEQVRLTARQGDVASRLTKLMKAKKLTPAEFKKLNIAKLAKLTDENLETIVSTFEAREDVISPTQKGSTDATDVANIGKNLEARQLRQLKNEARKDLMRMGKKLKDEAKEDYDKEMSGPKEYPDHPEKDPHAVEGEEKIHMKHLEELKKHLDSGNIEEAKKVHEKMSAYAVDGDEKHLEGGDVKSEDYKACMANMQKEVDEVKTQLARMAGMVHEMVKGEEGEEEENELAADPENKDKK